MSIFELKISITYTSILKEEYRNLEFITSLVEKASIANKQLSIGGKIEVQYPFKFIKQTIYGKESVIMSLYERIRKDNRHTITNKDTRVISKESNNDCGMVWVNREIEEDTIEEDTIYRFKSAQDVRLKSVNGLAA